MKATARGKWDPDLAHELPVAVIEPGQEQAVHLRNLTISTSLSRYYVKNFIPPEKVIDVLNAAGVRFMLAGAHAIGGWTNEPRTTQDVDVLVTARHVRAAISAISTAFPDLILRDALVVTRFVDPEADKVVIDVMKPNQPLFRDAMRFTHQIQSRKRTYFIPSLEFALAMKFSAMVSPRREQAKKLVDGADFVRMAKANRTIDLTKLAMLGDRVYRFGGREIVELVRKARADEPIQF